jgi:hypothetical protein
MTRTKTTGAQRAIRSLILGTAVHPTHTPVHLSDIRLPVLIVDAHARTHTLVGEIPWTALFTLCIDGNPRQYLVTPTTSPPYLSLPAFDCEPQGVKPLLAWINQAFASRSDNILPADLLKQGAWSLLDLCCIERALAVFDREDDCEALGTFICFTVLGTQLPVYELREALQILPRGSYWALKLLDHIRHRCKETDCRQRKDDLRPRECLHAWVSGNVELRKEMDRQRFGQYCEAATRQRIETWMLQINEKSPLPVGVFPHPAPGRHKQIPTLRRFESDMCGNIRLEWLEQGGGCYIETRPRERLYGMRPRRMKNTEVGRLWLASRGYGGVSNKEDGEEDVGAKGGLGAPRMDSGIGSLERKTTL